MKPRRSRRLALRIALVGLAAATGLAVGAGPSEATYGRCYVMGAAGQYVYFCV